MENGINLGVIWFDFDRDVNVVMFTCSNRYFSGCAQIYLSHSDALEAAHALSGFPARIGDRRHLELGTFDPNHADGGVSMDFYCSDAVGHAVVEVELRGDACRAMGEPESVALRLPIEAAGIDAFVGQLKTLNDTSGARAALPMAI